MFSILLIALFSGSAFAEGKFGFVNVQKAMLGTKEWQETYAKFKKSFEQEQLLISARERKIAKMLEDINKQSMVLDPALKKEKEDKFRSERRDFQRYVKDKSEEFTAKEKEMKETVLKKLVKVIKKIGKEKKFTLILDNSFVLYSDEVKDITDKVILIYDKYYSKK